MLRFFNFMLDCFVLYIYNFNSALQTLIFTNYKLKHNSLIFTIFIFLILNTYLKHKKLKM